MIAPTCTRLNSGPSTAWNTLHRRRSLVALLSAQVSKVAVPCTTADSIVTRPRLRCQRAIHSGWQEPRGTRTVSNFLGVTDMSTLSDTPW